MKTSNRQSIASIIVLLLMVVAASCVLKKSFSTDEIITFPDKNLEEAIRKTIGKNDGPIYRSELVGIEAIDRPLKKLTQVIYYNDSEFSYYPDNYWELQIRDLSGIEYCTSLEDL